MTSPSVGTHARSDPRTVSAEEISAFAETWDPRPFHLTGGERHELFDGVVASGLHTLLIAFRQAYDLGLDREAAIAGLGLTVRFMRPLRAGATVRTEVSVVALRPSSRPGAGVLTMQLVLDDGDEGHLMEAALDELVRHTAGPQPKQRDNADAATG